MSEISLKDYWDMLNRHDWYWQMSDDMRVYNEGQSKYKAIKELADTSIEHSQLFYKFEAHVWTGKPWNTEQTPKPERPA